MSVREIKKIRYGGLEYRRRERDVWRCISPSTYPCKTCGSPVARGYVCFFCNDIDPSPNKRVESK